MQQSLKPYVNWLNLNQLTLIVHILSRAQIALQAHGRPALQCTSKSRLRKASTLSFVIIAFFTQCRFAFSYPQVPERSMGPPCPDAHAHEQAFASAGWPGLGESLSGPMPESN